MRIALFHNVPSGGAKRAIYEWARRLVPNHQIDVYTLSGADHDFCDIRPFARQHHVVEFAPRRLYESPWGRVNQYQRLRDLDTLTEIGRGIAGEVDANEYDIVFAHTCRYTQVPTFLRFVQTPAVYYLHEPFGGQFIRPTQRPYLSGNGWRGALDKVDPLIRSYRSRLATIQHESLKHTDLLLANSLYTQEQMKLAFRVDAQVCKYGVDHDTFRPLLSVSKENCVISVGELTPRKGFDFIIASLGRIPAVHRPALNLACNIIDPAERAYLDQLADQYSVYLRIMEKLDARALAVEYNRAQMCVYAPNMEPLGLVPLEAMSCGIPVVGVSEAGVRETVVDGRNGYLTDRDKDEFADAVQELLDKPSLQHLFGRQGREYVIDHWTWTTSVMEIEQHLTETANQG